MSEVWYNSELWGDVFDPDTGEVTNAYWWMKREEYDMNHEYVQPLVIESVRTEKEFREYHLSFYGKEYSVQGVTDMTSLVCDWELKPSELKVVSYMIKEYNVVHHNICVIDMEDMSERTGLKRSTVYETLKKLEDKQIIKIPNCKLEEKGKKVFLMQPWFCFRGWKKMRQKIENEWFEFDYKPFENFNPDEWMKTK